MADVLTVPVDFICQCTMSHFGPGMPLRGCDKTSPADLTLGHKQRFKIDGYIVSA